MKKIEVQNPERRLRQMMVNVQTEFIRTCMSDTCSCMSHDSGFEVVSGDVPDHVEVWTGGGSPHGHARTLRADDERGKAAVMAARFPCAYWFDVEKFVIGGMTFDKAKDHVTNREARESAIERDRWLRLERHAEMRAAHRAAEAAHRRSQPLCRLADAFASLGL